MDRPWVVLFPGLALPPSRYRSFLEAVEEKLGSQTVGYTPAGVGARISDREPVRPEAMAAELLADLPPEEGRRIYVGHSAGAHAARAAARADPLASALILLDPNLGSAGRYDPADLDVPAVLSGWGELEATYAQAGVSTEHALREWWREQPDGTLKRTFSLEVIRSQLDAVPFGVEILREIAALSARMPVAVVRTTRSSVNGDAAWERLAAMAPEVAVLDVEVHHALPEAEQVTAAEAVLRWLHAS